MNYYDLLQFQKEPFSSSPEPEFLFELPQYKDCLQKLEMAVRLRRGMNVIIGDIGTGKTTLCRKLIQIFLSEASGSDMETHLLLDPAFHSAIEFLHTVASMMGIENQTGDLNSEWQWKEKIKNHLFDRGVDERKIIVLIIDEGQKIPEDCLEILREFLNYETNEFKLLQIIIFAQKEFLDVLKKKPNLYDRINLLLHLYPLNFFQMKAMIDYRVNVARAFKSLPSLFGFWGYVAIYLSTRGYPRRIVFLCHQVVLKMIVRRQNRAGWFLVRSCARGGKAFPLRRLGWGLAGILLIFSASLAFHAVSNHWSMNAQEKTARNGVLSSSVPKDERTTLKLPDCIGKVSMTKRRTIWWTLHNIYGDTGPEIVGALFRANPFLADGDSISEGTVIRLPFFPADKKPVKAGDSVVVLESGRDLESMYNKFRNPSAFQRLPALAFWAMWDPRKGFEYLIVIDKKYRNVADAELALAALPPDYAQKSMILSQWNGDTVFFNRRQLKY